MDDATRQHYFEKLMEAIETWSSTIIFYDNLYEIKATFVKKISNEEAI